MALTQLTTYEILSDQINENSILFPGVATTNITTAGDSNPPKKHGPNGKVDPIRDKQYIEQIKQYFLNKNQYRDYAIFVVGLNTGLRAGDLLHICIEDVIDQNGNFYSNNGHCTEIKEQKTGKIREVWFNQAAQEAILLYLKHRENYLLTEPLFISQKKDKHGNSKPINVRSYGEKLRAIEFELNLPFRLGTHSMRKSWSYHNIEEGTNITTIQHELNHSNQSITMAYAGRYDEERKQAYQLNL